MGHSVTRASFAWHSREKLSSRTATGAGNCPHGDTRPASLIMIRRCPRGSLAWNFSFVFVGQSRSLSISVRLVQVYLWGLSF